MTTRTIEINDDEAALILTPGDGDSIQMKVFVDAADESGVGQFAPVLRALTYILMNRQDLIIEAFHESFSKEEEGHPRKDEPFDYDPDEDAEPVSSEPDINKPQGNA